MADNQPIVNRFHKPKSKIEIPYRAAERAATRYVEDECGCWISTYSVASHGYAQVGWQTEGIRKVVTAHRAAWVYFSNEQIPDGYTIDHLCNVRRCVNPAHLRCITNFENARRTNGRDWEMGKCANGHPNSEMIWEGSRYRCGPCKRETQRRYREKRREKSIH